MSAAVALFLQVNARAAQSPGTAPANDAARSDEVVAALIPQPQEVALTGGDFVIKADTAIVRSHQAGESELAAIADFNDFLAGGGASPLKLVEEATDRDQSAGNILVGWAVRDYFADKALRNKRFPPDTRISQEGYQLLVGDGGIILNANTAAGTFYGLQTLKQLTRFDGGKAVVRGVRIADWPRYQLRGFQFDAGRAPHTIATMKRIVRICSHFKLNFVVFREGDDELCAVRYKTNRLGSQNPTAISIDEMAEFVKYASRYHVQVIPEIESLGHSSAKGFDYPDLIDDFGPKTRYPGIGIHHRKRRLILSKPEAYDLLKSIYSEWTPILNTRYMHLGCDEAGGGSPQHLARLYLVLKQLGDKNGKTIQPIVWADAAETSKRLKGEYIRCLWDYGDGAGVSLDNPHLIKQGIQYLVAPNCPEEAIMAGGSGSFHTALSKTSYDKAFANLYTWSQLGKGHRNFIGLFAVQWGGNQQDLWVPDYVVCAEYSWLPDHPAYDFDRLMARVKAALAKLKDYTNPRPDEVNRSAWDGIWLDEKGGWKQDIMGKALPLESETRQAPK
jgi:hypothetical protein